MKRIFFISLTACLIGISSFATEKNSPEVLKSFYKTFQNAKDVNWTQVDDMLRIGFILNGHQQFAYYCNDELVVVATEIETEELPMNLKEQLKDYKGFAVTHTYELDQNKVKQYCVVLDSSSKHLVLKGKNKWKVYLEEKK